MSDNVKCINKIAVKDLATDVTYLQTFVEKLGEPLLLQVFEELGQTIELLQSGNPEEFYDNRSRMKRYANVVQRTGNKLLDKLQAGEAEMGRQTSTPQSTSSGLMGRFR